MKQSDRKDELLEWLLCPKCKYTCVIRFRNGKIEEIKMTDA